MANLTDILEAIAAWFRSLGLSYWLVHWEYPAMMGIVNLDEPQFL